MITKFAGERTEKLRQFKALLFVTYWHQFSPSLIICKLMAFHNAPFPVGYVSHVYFDEASLAMQYSTMMCIPWLTPKTAHKVIFNGDICQLCPQVDWLMGESSMVAVMGILNGFATRQN
uniref:RNA helicase n=1 Tax=Plectus sambesii TaxID=2011161 RepID=A0A914UZP9_9BILA